MAKFPKFLALLFAIWRASSASDETCPWGPEGEQCRGKAQSLALGASSASKDSTDLPTDLVASLQVARRKIVENLKENGGQLPPDSLTRDGLDPFDRLDDVGHLKKILGATQNASVQERVVQRSARALLLTRAQNDRGLAESLDAVARRKNDNNPVGQVLNAVGTLAGNAATFISSTVQKIGAIKLVQDIADGVKNQIGSIGDFTETLTAVASGQGSVKAGGLISFAGAAAAGVRNAANTLKNEGSKAVNTFQSSVDSAVATLDATVKDVGEGLGQLATGIEGLASNLKGPFTEILKCINLNFGDDFCPYVLAKFCDCDDGSSLKFNVDTANPGNSEVDMKCKLKLGPLTQVYGFEASASSSISTGDRRSNKRKKLGGTNFVQNRKASGSPRSSNLRTRGGMKSKRSRAPRASCEGELDIAAEGAIQFEPRIDILAKANGEAELSVSLSILASADFMAEGEGSCSLTAERRFPRVPRKKVVCGKFFCILIMVQGLMEVELEGTLTGAVELAAEAEFSVSGTIKLKVGDNGKAEADFEKPTVSHQQGFSMAASVDGFARLGLGPVVVIFPMPGIPITLNPMMNAELKYSGTLAFKAENAGQITIGLMQEDALVKTKTSEIDICAAASLNVFADLEVTGIGFPKALEAALSLELGTTWFLEALTEAVTESVESLIDALTAPLANVKTCLGNVQFFSVPEELVDKVKEVLNAVKDAALAALGELLVNFNIDISLPPISLVPPEKLFCVEVLQTPGFDKAPCAAELGCSATERPPSVDAVAPPAEIKTDKTVVDRASTCHTLPMGTNFIDFGGWRLASFSALLSLHLPSLQRTIMMWGDNAHLYPGPRNDYFTTQAASPAGSTQGVEFGFQHIRIGNFQVGADDDDHFVISHKTKGAIQVFKASDRTIHSFDKSRHLRNLNERGEGPADGVSFGFEFLQLGKFRMGVDPLNRFHIEHVDHGAIQRYQLDGNRVGPGTSQLFGRGPVRWPCRSIQEQAYGGCTKDFPTLGDRTIDFGLGSGWRLKVLPEDGKEVLGFILPNGIVSRRWKNDASDRAGIAKTSPYYASRMGYASGIQMGYRFIQIGSFRIGDVTFNGHHYFTICHLERHRILELIRQDGHITLPSAADEHHFDLWRTRSTGLPVGVTFGRGFIQIGIWRLGYRPDLVAILLSINHPDVASGSQLVMQSDGNSFANNVNPMWIGILQPQWHCPPSVNVCPGITTGLNFIQIGKWRLGARDGNHLSLSHANGNCDRIWTVANNPLARNVAAYGMWAPSDQAAYYADGTPGKVKFGDHYIQIGNFRVGVVAGVLAVSHVVGSRTLQYFDPQGNVYNLLGSDTARYSSYSPWGSGDTQRGVSFGDRFIQIGQYRLGDVDGRHFSFSHQSGKTQSIFREDALADYPGPRDDFTTFGREIADCVPID